MNDPNLYARLARIAQLAIELHDVRELRAALELANAKLAALRAYSRTLGLGAREAATLPMMHAMIVAACCAGKA